MRETTGSNNCVKYSCSTFCITHYLNRYCVREDGKSRLLHITPQHYGKHNRQWVSDVHSSSHIYFAINHWKCNVWTHKQGESAVTYEYLYHPGGTALQVVRSWFRFPMVSLEFSVDIILLAALWFWGRTGL